jgi:hypothetical protein
MKKVTVITQTIFNVPETIHKNLPDDMSIEDWIRIRLNLDKNQKISKIVIEENQEPYIESANIIVEQNYNPVYGDDRICICGHPYHRHFDSFENMKNVGCKYCDCYDFVEDNHGHPNMD